MKKNYTVSLNADLIEELKDKFAVSNLSELIDNLILSYLKQQRKAKETLLDSVMTHKGASEIGIPTWWDNLSLPTFNRLKTDGRNYFKFLHDAYGSFNENELLEYLEDKYKNGNP